MTKDEAILPELPSSWLWSRLGDISLIEAGGTPSTKDPDNFGGDIPWVTPADLSGFDGKFISKGSRSITEKGLRSSSAKMLPAGTIIFSSRAPIGYVAIAINALCTNQGCKNFILPNGIFNEYVFYYLKGNKTLAESYASGTTFLELSAKKAAMLPIPIPPLPEQHRIVARIEELFSHLDAGLEALQKAKAQLHRYRKAVLKAAMEGKLTEVWRKAHPDVEPAAEILKGRLSQDRSGPSELPEGWIWAELNEVGEWFGGGTPSKRVSSYWSNGSIPWISPKDMKSEKIYDSQDKITIEAIRNSSAKLIPPGSLLFVVRSGIIQRMLPIASLKVDAAVNQDLKALTPNRGVDEDYLLYSTLALSENIRNNCSKDGTTVQSIEFKLLKKFLIPLPPFKEQQEIVKKIESHQPSLIDVEQSICINLTNAYLLRQSILKSAFEGKLVPQDPNDEPASVLLEKNYEEHLGKKKESTPLKRANRKGMIVLNEILSIYEVLSKAGTQLTPEELFKKANFSEETVDEFYQELREEVERSRIIEIRPNDADVYLQAVKNEDK